MKTLGYCFIIGFFLYTLTACSPGGGDSQSSTTITSSKQKNNTGISITPREMEKPEVMKKTSLLDKKREVRRSIDEISAKVDKEIDG